MSSLIPTRNGARRFPSWLQISATLCGSRECADSSCLYPGVLDNQSDVEC